MKKITQVLISLAIVLYLFPSQASAAQYDAVYAQRGATPYIFRDLWFGTGRTLKIGAGATIDVTGATLLGFSSAGTTTYYNSGAPSAGTGVTGDSYVDTATGDHYKKTGPSTWGSPLVTFQLHSANLDAWSAKTAYAGALSITTGKTFSVTDNIIFSTDGTGTRTLNIGAGGTLGTAAFTAASAYEVPLTFSAPLNRSTNTISLNNTAVTPGTYTLATVTIGADGRITGASNGSAGAGDVTAAIAFGTDNVLLRSDGVGKGAQASGISVDDSNNVTGINNLGVTTLTASSQLYTAGAAPATPAAGKVTVYAKSDKLMYSKDDAGAETPLYFTPSDVAFASSWNANTGGPTKNAVYDQLHLFDTDDNGKVNVLDQGVGVPVTNSSGVLQTPITTRAQLLAAISDLNTPRIGTTASSATPSINVDVTDMYTITALATAITSVTITGTPVNGQKLIIRILDNGTARAIALGASFAARGAALPTTTVISKYLYIGTIYNSTTSTWDCVATAQES